jgi:hemerythrin-like domain-containing protein
MSRDNLFDVLREDHQRQRTLADLLAQTRGDSEGRDELFTKLRDELERHAEAEERTLYRSLMAHDSTMDMARHSVAEHHELDELLEKLAETDRSSPAWKATARKLCDRVHHHVDEEEREVFPWAGRVLTDEEKLDLGEAFRNHKQAIAAK